MKARRVAGYRSARAAAIALGAKSATYAAHENGTRTFSIADARRYAALYEVSPGWILTGEQFDEDQFGKIGDETPPKPANTTLSRESPTVFNADENLSNRDIENLGKQVLELVNQLSLKKETELTDQTMSVGEVVVKSMIHDDVAPDDEQWEFVSQWQIPTQFLSGVLNVAPIDVAIIAVVDDNMVPIYNIDDRLIVDFEQKKFTVDGVYFYKGQDEQVHIQRIKRKGKLLEVSNDNPAGSSKHPQIIVSDETLEIQGRVCGVIAAR